MQWKKGDECRVRRPARGTRDGEFLDGIVIKVNPKTIWVRYKITPLFDDECKAVKCQPEDVRPI
jgi:hypothetical protein